MARELEAVVLLVHLLDVRHHALPAAEALRRPLPELAAAAARQTNKRKKEGERGAVWGREREKDRSGF